MTTGATRPPERDAEASTAPEEQTMTQTATQRAPTPTAIQTATQRAPTPTAAGR